MSKFPHLPHLIVTALSLTFCSTVLAQPLSLNDPRGYTQQRQARPSQDDIERQGSSSLSHISPHLRRQIVNYATRETSGTVVIDTPGTSLYYVLGGGRAIRYGIGVGREGFTWSGTRFIDRKVEWPDWTPPPEMITRQPYLPRFMAGGPGNPLGARAMYLGGTLYRIHGTNDPSSIGKHVSSGCIRMLNEDVIDLYERTSIGTKVVVLPDRYHRPLVGSADSDAAAAQLDRETAEVPYYGPSRSFSVRRQRQ